MAYWVRGPSGGRTVSPCNFGNAKTISCLVEGGRTLGGCRGSQGQLWACGFRFAERCGIRAAFTKDRIVFYRFLCSLDTSVNVSSPDGKVTG